MTIKEKSINEHARHPTPNYNRSIFKAMHTINVVGDCKRTMNENHRPIKGGDKS